MGKQRKSKRQLVRDEKRKKKRDREAEDETAHEAKRQRREHHDGDVDPDYVPLDGSQARLRGEPEREFFGMLADEEQEYFRRSDELLELNDFATPEDRDIFLENVYREARGKELKLASSQSCSRLMERLILLSNPRQKKHIFEAFASHFVSLITHRFASHCCESLFIHSAPIVTRELSGADEEKDATGQDGPEGGPPPSMEELFLLALDELEEHLTYLISDKFGSHTLRVLLVVLSGRPLGQVSTKSLLQSKRKEHVSVSGVATSSDVLNAESRVVPGSFTMAVQKIIKDTTSSLDPTALRVLASHPTGNPVLQLLLELDMSLNGKSKDSEGQLLLDKLLPGAPQSLGDAASQACEFVNSTLYDPIGSRLLETIVAHCSGKVFKALHANFFGPRIQTFARSDIASYPAIKALNRMSKDDLAAAVQKVVPEVPKLLDMGRYNVLKTLFERCHARHITSETDQLLQAVYAAYGTGAPSLVPKLCFPDEDASGASKKEPQQLAKSQAALASHGSQLISTLLGIPGTPTKAVQTSLLSLKAQQVLHLATSSMPTVAVLTTALATPSKIPTFHKALVATLTPYTRELATSNYGHNILNAIVEVPSKGQDRSIPFHMKETIMTTLASYERELRDCWMGRSVWRTWRGDQWRRRRSDWVRWMKEFDLAPAREDPASKPWSKSGHGKGFGGGRRGGDAQTAAA